MIMSGTANGTIPDKAKHVCMAHYQIIEHVVNTRQCTSSHNESCWKTISEVGSVDTVAQAFELPAESTTPYQWICKYCRLYLTDKHTLTNVLQADVNSSDELTKKRAEIIQNAIEKVKEHGIAFTKDLVTEL